MNIKDTYKQVGQLVAFKSTRSGKYIVCQVNNIIYIQKVKDTHDCNVFFVNSLGECRSVVVRMSISDLNEITPNQFVLCNRNTIVNIRFISEYDDSTITMLTPLGELSVPCTCWDGTKIVEIEK